MSNLYKQYFVHTEPNNKRVINSNELVEQRLEKVLTRERLEQEAKETGDDSFSAGIINQDTEYVEEISEEESAREEADRILEEARQKADDILNEASQKAAMLRQQASEEGYLEGAKKQEIELAELKMKLQQEFDEQKSRQDNDYQIKLEHMENNLVDVIIEVFNKVFHIQFENKKHILMYLIGDAILNIEGDKKFRIKVAESNLLYLENHKESILERVGQGIEIEIIADSSLDGNDCIIETDSGVFDCSLGVQLENLIKDIRSLCS